MNNNFTCLNDFSDIQYRAAGAGWMCMTGLPFSVTENNSNYYVRCLDQPWLTGENATKRNADTQSYPLSFTRVHNPLNIDYVNVENQTLTFSGTAAGSVEVDVRTSGGLDGTAECGYLWGNTTIDFYNTYGTEHSQVFQALLSGANSLTIVCKDSIGDIAQRTVNFKIVIDNTAPLITRVYQQSGFLNLITNEQSTCYFSTDLQNQCLFNIDNSSIMIGENSTVHTTPMIYDQTYYLKCIDSFGNYPGDCSIVLKGVK